MTQIPMEAVSDNGHVEAEVATSDFEIGSDLLENVGEVDVSEGTETPDRASGSTEESNTQDNNIDLDIIDPEKMHTISPEEAKHLHADYTRKTQSLADERRANAQTALRLQQLEQRLNERVDRLAAGDQVSQESQDPFADLRERLDQDEARAVDVIDQIDTIRNGQFRDETNQKIDQLANAMKRVLQLTVQQMGQKAEVETANFRETYSDWDSTLPQRKAMANKIPTPATGKPYTQAEVHRMVKGLSSQESQQLQQSDRRARRQPTTLPPSNRPTIDSGGNFTDTELTSAMQDLGFA